MTLSFTETRGTPEVGARLQGRLDTATAPALEEQVGRWLDGGARDLELDCRDLEYVSSAGLRVFLGAVKRLKPQGGRLVLVGTRGVVREVLDLAGFGALVELKEDGPCPAGS